MLLRQAPVIKIPLPIIIVRSIAGPTQQVICKSHHMVDGAVFLGLISQTGGKLSRRCPEFTVGLPACAIISSIDYCAAPVSFSDIPPAVFPSHLPGTRCPEDFRDGSVGVHVRKGIFSSEQRVKQTRAIITID